MNERKKLRESRKYDRKNTKKKKWNKRNQDEKNGRKDNKMRTNERQNSINKKKCQIIHSERRKSREKTNTFLFF